MTAYPVLNLSEIRQKLKSNEEYLILLKEEHDTLGAIIDIKQKEKIAFPSKGIRQLENSLELIRLKKEFVDIGVNVLAKADYVDKYQKKLAKDEEMVSQIKEDWKANGKTFMNKCSFFMNSKKGDKRFDGIRSLYDSVKNAKDLNDTQAYQYLALFNELKDRKVI